MVEYRQYEKSEKRSHLVKRMDKKMNTRILDGATLRGMLIGGANGIRSQIDEINELNVFPVPDGDTGTNMTRTVESGIARVMADESENVGDIAESFVRWSIPSTRWTQLLT